MSTHNICFYGELTKIIVQLSSNTLLISYWPQVYESIFVNRHTSRLMIKPTKGSVHPTKTPISLGIRPVWSESLLSAWRNRRSLATNWSHSEDWSDWMDAQADLSLLGTHVILLVLSCCHNWILDILFYQSQTLQYLLLSKSISVEV